jgi:hypothetical protein
MVPDRTVHTPPADPAELVERAVNAFRKGNRDLLVSRLETGLYCHLYYAAGFTTRAQSTRFLAAALAPHAEGRRGRDANPAGLARLWGCAECLGGLTAPDLAGGAALGALTLGRLEALSSLVLRPEGSEEYRLFSDDAEKQQAARALWGAAYEGRVGLGELADRVLALRDPEKHAAKHGPDAEGPTTPAPAGAENPADQRGTVSGNLLNPETAYTAPDAAELAAGILAKSDRPDDAFERLLKMVATHGDFSRGTQRAVKAALVRLHQADSPSLVQVAAALAAPTANGTAAAV